MDDQVPVTTMVLMEDHSTGSTNVRVSQQESSSSKHSVGTSSLKSKSSDCAGEWNCVTTTLADLPIPSGHFQEMQQRTTMRVRISNEISERSKDLVVDIRPSVNLYSAVYDSKSVKEAHVRKWGPEIAQKVKNGTAEIQCAVWDDVVGKPCHTFSLEELKETSTAKLYELVPESDIIKLVLRCSDKEVEPENNTSSFPTFHPPLSSLPTTGEFRCPFSGVEINADILEQFTQHILSQRAEDEKSQSSQESPSPEAERGSFPEHSLPSEEIAHTMSNSQGDDDDDSFTVTIKSTSTGTGSCGPEVISVRVSNQHSHRTRDVLLPINDQKNMFDTVYENPVLKQGHVRKWSSALAKQVKSGELEIQLAVLKNSQPVQCFTVEQLKTISTARFYQILIKEQIPIKDVVCLELRCTNKQLNGHDDAKAKSQPIDSAGPLIQSTTASSANQDSSDDESDDQDHISELNFASSHLRQDSVPLELFSGIARNQTDPSIGDTLLSLDLDLESISGDVPMAHKQALRVRISNRTSHRFKDLVVDINDNLNLYDSVYDNKGVKDAHVRKWGSQIVQDVKEGRAEVQVVVWDDDSARPWRVFKLDDLKTTTTRDLYESVPESCDLVKLFLECVRTKPAPQSLRLEKGKPQLIIPPTSMRHCKSESCLKNGTSRRTPTRLNHMNLSGLSIGSNSSSLSDRVSGAFEKPLSNEFWNKLATVTDHNRQIGRPPRRKNRGRQIDIDAYLMKSKTLTDGRSLSSADMRGNFNETWSRSTHSSTPNEEMALSAKVQRFLQLSERRGQTSDSSQSLTVSPSSGLNCHVSYEDQIKEFMRLCNAKRTTSLQSVKNSQQSKNGSTRNETFPRIVQTHADKDELFLSRVSSITLQDRRATAPPLRGIPNATFAPHDLEAPRKSSGVDETNSHLTNGKVSDRINRFLRLSQPDRKLPSTSVFNKVLSASESTLSLKSSLELLQGDHSHKTPKAQDKQASKDLNRTQDTPPVAEIEVFRSADEQPGLGIALSPELVKEVFPYHVMLNSNFRILQVGNNLAQFVDEGALVGRTVSDILMVTSPIPMFGKWDWNIMDKMKDKTIFLESVLTNSSNIKVKIKGTIIEVSSSPRTVMLALFPNVKNLSELEDMNLSMGDLPLHSCQREAVLLGEHSKSEVKLTNHLDQLHRELINSMEKQIEDRTNELAMANLDLERANSQLAIQSARQLEHFACMSHEIRTPLNCIVGMSSLLLDDADDMDPMHADSIRMINTSGDLLKAVVDDVLDYAKLESGSFEVDIKPTNLQETLASVVHSISQRVQEKNIRLRTHYSPTLPLVLETDSRRLQQVLFNLLGNAGKFSKPNSVIDLSVTLMTGPLKQEQGQPIKYSPSGQIIRFSIMDYGKGIDKKDFTTIFEPFSQASKETQNIYGGTGLGLSITSKLVHRLGGTVGLDSEPGMFTEFTVDLPFCGTPVDIEDVRKKMKHTTLIVVEPMKIYDYSFTEHTIKGEPVPFDEKVAEIYQLDVVRCSSLHDAINQLHDRQKLDTRRHFALLVDEVLFDVDAKDVLDSLVKASDYTLMTFGPNFSIDLTKEWHFKSLIGVFPATLLETIAYHRVRQRYSAELVDLDASMNTDTDVMESDNREQFASYAQNIGPPKKNSAPAGGLFALLSQEVSRPVEVDNTVVVSIASSENQKGMETVEISTKPVRGGLFASLSSATDQDSIPVMKEISPKPTPKSVDGLFAPLQNDTAKRSVGNGMVGRSVPGNAPSRNSSIRQLTPPRRSSKTKNPKRTLKVMYVEDNVVNQKVLSKMLSRAGIEDITIADNGKKAVDICETQKFDVIFMDYEMPIMDGMEATKLIVDRHPTAKVIFVTAHALEEFKTKARSVGAIGFFSKPVRANDIEALLDGLDEQNSPAVVETAEAHLKNRATRETSDVADKANSRTMTARRDLKVLYAEDNIVNQKVLSRALSRAGLHDVTIVANGKLAVELCQTIRFDCIFMDVEMPVMGGLEACQKIIENDSSALVVFVTAHGLDDFKKKGDAVGAWDYISKPFRLNDIGELLDRVEVACRKFTFERRQTSPAKSESPRDALTVASSSTVLTAKSKPSARELNLKVLYAEDNIVNQKVLSRVLNRAGISDITIVDNGQSAVDLCRTVKYSCIFLDMQMPVMDGIEACRQIVKDDPDATVIFVTAHALDEFKAQAVAIGAKSFISKPFRLSDIQKVLDELNLQQ